MDQHDFYIPTTKSNISIYVIYNYDLYGFRTYKEMLWLNFNVIKVFVSGYLPLRYNILTLELASVI